jgi:ABC-type sugar transport system, periplasmic component
MSRNTKIIMAMLLCVVFMASFFAGCGSKQDASTETTQAQTTAAATTVAPTEANSEITFWFYPRYTVAGKENGVFENELKDAFVKDNPNIKVNVEMLAYDAGPEKVNVAISSNSMPDGLFDYPGRIIGYGYAGVLADLTDMFTDADKSDIPAALLNQCSLDGKVLMYPTAVTAVMMAVNKDLWKQAGVDNLLPLDKPDRAWKLSDFETALKGLKKLSGVSPVAFYAGNEQGDASFRMFIQNFGADFVDEGHTKVVINSEAGVKGLQWVLDAYNNGLIAKGAESMTSSDALDLFYQSKVATSLIYSPGNVGIFNKMVTEGKAKNFDMAFMPMPTQDGSAAKVETQVCGFCVFDNKDANKIAASKKFIDFLANNKDNIKAVSWFPVRSSFGDLYDNPELKFASSMTKNAGDTGYTIKNYAKVRALWYPEIQAVLTKAKTPKDALDEFAAQATDTMNQ